METFSLIIWLMIGQRFEQTEIPNLTRQECVGHWLRIRSDREPVKTQCVAPDYKEPPKPKSVVICPTWPPCWRDGVPIQGAL
jgi:hypothetical protein